MIFDSFVPVIRDQKVMNPREDYRNAEKYGPCRLSAQAVYMPDKTYVLRSAVERAIADMGCAHVTGCCAGGIPVPRVVIITATKKIPVLFDTTPSAEQFAALLNGQA